MAETRQQVRQGRTAAAWLAGPQARTTEPRAAPSCASRASFSAPHGAREAMQSAGSRPPACWNHSAHMAACGKGPIARNIIATLGMPKACGARCLPPPCTAGSTSLLWLYVISLLSTHCSTPVTPMPMLRQTPQGTTEDMLLQVTLHGLQAVVRRA